MPAGPITWVVLPYFVASMCGVIATFAHQKVDSILFNFSGSLHGAQDESKTSRGVENAARHQQPQRESANHPQSRLTQADHPLFTGANGGSTGGGFKADWSTALTMESQARGITKSVLVLNGAACFVAGKLASTGEPHVSQHISHRECEA